MVFGPLIGAGLGALAGVGIGSAVFSGDRPKDFNFITEAADKNDNIRTPACANVTDEMRGMIPLTPEWTFWPDYDRWVMINRMIRLLWPKLTSAILLEVVKAVKPIVQQNLNAIPGVLSLIDDITLGPYSIMDADHLDPHIADKYFTLGEHPVRVAGMKVYSTAEDTCIMEMPLIWGSNAVFDVQVYLKLGPARVVIPVHISHIQYKALARVVLNMVDTIPCIGGATLSLLQPMHLDYSLRLFNGPDMMALPGVKQAVDWAIGMVLKDVLLYPNSVSVPLMTNFGVPPEPQGMVKVTLTKIENLKTTDLLTKGDPYVVFEIREGRVQRSKTVKSSNNPVFNQEFFTVVDDFQQQKLSIKVYDYDRLCPTDDLLGTAEVFFSEEAIESDPATGGEKVAYHLADWIKSPMSEKKLVLPLHMAGGGLLKVVSKGIAKTATGATGAMKRLVSMKSGGSSPDMSGKTIIMVAKTAKEVRLEEERKAAAEAAAAAQKEAAEKAAAAQKASTSGSSSAEAAAAAAAAAARVPKAAEAWSDEDEKALWAEWKRLADEKKAAAAAEAKRRKALTKEQREAEDAAKKAAEEAAKKAEEEIVLVEQEVVLRGNGSTAVEGTKPVGMMHITLQYMPFEHPTFDDDIELTPVKGGFAQYVPFTPPKPRQFISNINDFQRGLLTVTIFKASKLATPGSLTNPDAYVEMLLVDCDPRRPSETQKTSVKFNDNTPRWCETFDFVMISAGSVLTLSVVNKTGILDATLSLKLSKSRFQDQLLGKLQIPVADVARNGHLKDTWPLLEAESGTLEMKLSWSNCHVEQYMD
ncbi:hypothetical protein OEZ86_005594 [Tetradesmus obliquus]|nr:hypothetical protein OEZ86_005594 [Tetradesmus obliquus]